MMLYRNYYSAKYLKGLASSYVVLINPRSEKRVQLIKCIDILCGYFCLQGRKASKSLHTQSSDDPIESFRDFV